jgi:transposase
MVIIGVDPHPDSHTLVALDHNGAVLDSLIVGNSSQELHEELGSVLALLGD